MATKRAQKAPIGLILCMRGARLNSDLLDRFSGPRGGPKTAENALATSQEGPVGFKKVAALGPEMLHFLKARLGVCDLERVLKHISIFTTASTVQYCTVLYNTAQHCTVLCSTVHH